MEEHYIGVDLGGTKILAGIFDADTRCLTTEKTKTKSEHGYDAVCARIVSAVRSAAESAGIDLAKVTGAGIGAPGSISRSSESIRACSGNGIRLVSPGIWRIALPIQFR